MNDLKTQKTDADVQAFLDTVEDETKREDCQAVLEIMRRVTGEEPAMWGTSIVGFGSYHYKYDSGREGAWPLTGFAPRKAALTLYIMSGFEGEREMLAKLGRHKTGRACLYIKRLADVDLAVLERLIASSAAATRRRHAG